METGYRIENYRRALERLEQAATAYTAAPADALYRDGLIQRFEFTVELAWKSLKEYLSAQGVIFEVISPRAVLKEACAAGVLKDQQIWNDILAARNVTSQVYEEQTAVTVAQRICADFLPALQALDAFYRD